MKRFAFVLLLALFAVAVGLIGYYRVARADAIEDSRYLERYADKLIDQGRTGDALGQGREAVLFRLHALAGTTVSQSLAKRLAFEHYRGGLGGIRAAGYAQGLEERLSQRQIMALWLETVEMGASDKGWMEGFFATSYRVYGRLPARLTDREFLHLAAVIFAPRRYHLNGQDPALEDRVDRLERLISDDCRPRDETDLKLEGCADDS